MLISHTTQTHSKHLWKFHDTFLLCCAKIYIKFKGSLGYLSYSSTCGSNCGSRCRCWFRSPSTGSLPLSVPEVVFHATFVHRALRRSLCAPLWVHQQLHISNLEKHRYMILVVYIDLHPRPSWKSLGNWPVCQLSGLRIIWASTNCL